MNNQDIAKKVIEALGGRENVNSVAMTGINIAVNLVPAVLAAACVPENRG